MDSIEKLREYGHSVFNTCQQEQVIDALADEIEREISERYMLLPVDADGTHIHMGDEVIAYSSPKFRGVVQEVHITQSGWEITVCGLGLMPSELHHVKPRTLEDVLIDAMQFGFSSHAGDDVTNKAREFADEIRDLLGGEGE